MKYCHKLSDIPETEHFAAVSFSTYTIPGDERSRTNPGHGYPESTGISGEYIAFDDRAECDEWVKSRENRTLSSSSYRIIKATPMKVEKIVTIKLS